MNKIHPTVIIGKDVILGDGNEILPYTIIEGPVTIGNNNVIGPHVIIGCPATEKTTTNIIPSFIPLETDSINLNINTKIKGNKIMPIMPIL